MQRGIDELNKVAVKIEQQVESAVDRWHTLPDKILTFRPSRRCLVDLGGSILPQSRLAA